MLNPVKLITRKLRADMIQSYINDRNYILVLDVGAGKRELSKILKEAEYHSFDIEDRISIERPTPYKTGSFDFVVLGAVYEHLEDPGKALKEIHRILKKGGFLLITTPKKKAHNLMKFYDFIKRESWEHKHYYTQEDFKNLKGFRLLLYDPFMFGLNQFFLLEAV